MPGVHLNDIERRLKGWWENRAKASLRYPLIEGISVQGDPGLRGLKDIHIEFNYPLTVICGRNGCGKTTVLALAALAFHSPPRHYPFNAIRKPKDNEDFTYYTFRDFFFQGPGDPNLAGIEISWKYFHEGRSFTKRIKKETQKWMRYPTRPERPVHFLGISRSVPAIEQLVLRNYFAQMSSEDDKVVLSEEYVRRLSDILGRQYDGATELIAAKYSLRSVRAGNQYSSFNMGLGEDNLITLLLILQNCPAEALIIIEEIELGLHPEALRKLAQHLLEITYEKKLQVIVSTHSQFFLDYIPRQARLLIQKEGDSHLVTPSVTTRYAMGQMSGISNPELYIYCEDVFSAELIEAALDGHILKRVKILPVGCDSELCNHVKYHLKSDNKAKFLIVWDGEVTDEKAKRWISTSGIQECNYVVLPGGLPPEEWCIKVTNCHEGWESLSDFFKLPIQEIREYLDKLKSLRDKHDIFHEWSNLTGRSIDKVRMGFLNAVANLPHRPLKMIQEAVETTLSDYSSSKVAATYDE